MHYVTYMYIVDKNGLGKSLLIDVIGEIKYYLIANRNCFDLLHSKRQSLRWNIHKLVCLIVFARRRVCSATRQRESLILVLISIDTTNQPIPYFDCDDRDIYIESDTGFYN